VRGHNSKVQTDAPFKLTTLRLPSTRRSPEARINCTSTLDAPFPQQSAGWSDLPPNFRSVPGRASAA
jgi:hypothetical protein